MAETTIVPPTPTVSQGSDVMSVVQAAFDKAAPEIRGTPKSSEPPKTEQPPQAAPEVVKPPIEPQKAEAKQTEKTTEKPSDESHKVPSFLEEVLKSEPKKPQAQTDEEWPEELPTFKTSEESKSRYKTWRDKYQQLKKENETLKSRPNGSDEATTARLAQLETTAKQQAELLARVGVEQHADFQNNVVRPLHAAWNEACRLVKDSGGDPNELARAESLQGKSKFEALDQVMEGMPQSAKDELHVALRQFRQLDRVRRTALSNAPKTMEELRKKDMADQYKVLTQQRKEMETLFEDAVKTLREEAKVELLQTSADPDAKEWNEQADQIIKDARSLYLENTDMRKMALATVLAPMVDRYRKLWLSERIAHAKTKKTLNGKFESEPNLSSSGGNHSVSSEEQFKQDLKEPFSKVFIRELGKQTAGRRG